MKIGTFDYKDPKRPNIGRIDLVDESDGTVARSQENFDLSDNQAVEAFIVAYKESLAGAETKKSDDETKSAELTATHAGKLVELQAKIDEVDLRLKSVEDTKALTPSKEV